MNGGGKSLRLWLPLALFVVVAAVVATALYAPADRTVRSQLVGRALPAIALPAMLPGKPAPPHDATGRPRLVNIFASWCIPCAAEAPQLAQLRAAGVTVDGIAVRDTPAGVAGFLARYGDPYRAVGDDRGGAVQLSLGSSGVPESYLIDAQGRILDQHVGAIRPEDVAAIVAQAGPRAEVGR